MGYQAHQPGDTHVLIVGAGASGLLLAQALKKNAIKCTVFEKEASANHYRPREWGMSIQWALPLLEQILPEHLWSTLHAAAVDPYYEPSEEAVLPTINGATGELIKNLPLGKFMRVSRRRFRTFCTEGIDVQYDKTIEDVEFDSDKEHVTAIFHDGSRATGTLLVGADGAHSRVRASILGAEKAAAKAVPYRALNLHVCYKDAKKALFIRRHLNPIAAIGVHPDGYWLWCSVQEIPDPDRPETWVFQLQTTWKRTSDNEDVTSLEMQKKRAQTFGEPFRSANLWIPDGTALTENKISYWSPIEYDTHQGRVTWIGDAAHPMTFQLSYNHATADAGAILVRGQGLNHGIADVVKLADELITVAKGTTTKEAAVANYNSEMVKRAGDEVLLSLQNAEMLHDWQKMIHSPLMQKGGAAVKRE